MTSQEIEKGNKLIATYMGAKLLPVPVGHANRTVSFPKVTHGLCVHRGDELEYHSNWNWLIPVIENIWKAGKMISLNFYNEAGGVVNAKIYNWELGSPYQETEESNPIDAVYTCVLQFLEWYNSQQVK